ncbi:hypothetical protein Q4543_01815 [Salipiger sp. 1_MG-2023]|uniref:MotE family protein n=1 Tax=Salipiger sp. 1_MG-2023 TaxID=3062665 RepID=UPI0026E13AFA|nr:hypothetical protein [Salipiger sp. 1_MG-2023]MDO6584243.1 hypothetical protein [Salipiger sp. 1_MG-2023]
MISLFRKVKQKPAPSDAQTAAKPTASRAPTRAGTTSKPKRRRGKGVLAIIGGLLIASALTRVAIQATAAIALETGAPSNDAIASEHGAGVPGNSVAACTAEEDIAPVLSALKAREERITKRETDIETRMQALSIAEQEIDRKLVALEEAEVKLRSTLAMAKTAADDDVDRLTQVYASMKPKQASALFEEMDPEFSAGFLGRMRPDAAAAIMAGLTPATAYTISAMLAGRNANAPRQ